MNDLETQVRFNFPALMVQRMKRVINPQKGRHGLAYGYLLSRVFNHFQVKCGKGQVCTKKEMIDKKTLRECGFGKPGLKVKSTVANLLDELQLSRAHVISLESEIHGLRQDLKFAHAQFRA